MACILLKIRKKLFSIFISKMQGIYRGECKHFFSYYNLLKDKHINLVVFLNTAMNILCRHEYYFEKKNMPF